MGRINSFPGLLEEIEITANRFKIIEENGSLVERAFIEDPVRNLFLRDFKSLESR